MSCVISFFLTVLFSGVFSSNALSSETPPLPAGWKAATPVKNSGCDRKTKDLLSALGDFDGDKKDDRAMILSKKDGDGLGLWVWLASQKDPILIETVKAKDGKHDMGILVVPKGNYDTACGKGYWECKSNETPKIQLSHPGIDFFTCESANRYFYWSEKNKKFVGIWISD